MPRITQPVLMLNARYDYLMAGHEKVFELLGTPPEDKKLVLYDTGHSPLPKNQVTQEINAWLDRYLGPVTR